MIFDVRGHGGVAVALRVVLYRSYAGPSHSPPLWYTVTFLTREAEYIEDVRNPTYHVCGKKESIVVGVLYSVGAL